MEILIAGIFAAVALVAIAAPRYRKWINDCARRLEGSSSLIGTRNGPIEYAAFGESYPIILFVHGHPGGYDQGKVLEKAGFQSRARVISFSRPGYLRTPLVVGRSPREQADAFAEALRGLSAPSVAVVGLSGGGPTAVELALRHPANCSALVLISAVTLAMAPPTRFLSRLLATQVFTSNLAGWLLTSVAARWPALLVRSMVPGAQLRADVLADPRKLSILVELAQAGVSLPARRRTGSRNDAKQVAALPSFPLRTMRVPTLVIHGTDDELVPFSHALNIANNVPGAELHAIDGGPHVILATHLDQVLSRLFTFIGEHLDQEPAPVGPS